MGPVMTNTDHVNISDFGMDTISLAGTLPQKLAAISGAGFTQVIASQLPPFQIGNDSRQRGAINWRYLVGHVVI